MDDRATPLNDTPLINGQDVDLHKLFKVSISVTVNYLIMSLTLFYIEFFIFSYFHKNIFYNVSIFKIHVLKYFLKVL